MQEQLDGEALLVLSGGRCLGENAHTLYSGGITDYIAYNALEISNQETQLEDSLSVPPMLLILDEANLSPMEYYWADFMAVCDSTVPISIDLGEDVIRYGHCSNR